MIRLEHASRWYGQVIGLNDVTCRIPAGLTALLGPNGAGKSTLIKLITGQLRPTTGAVQVLGRAPFADRTVLRQLGYCPEIDSFYEEMTGREFVTLLAAMSGLSGETLRKQVGDALERVGMADRCGRKIGGYSKGMRQRIKVAQAIVHDPRVLMLDEPLNGLDPVGRQEISQLMIDFGNAGKCVLISSHILHEVEQLTQNILLIQRGRLVAQGNIHAIRGLIDRHPHHIAITTDRARDLAAALLGLPGVLGVRFDPLRADHLEIETNQPDRFYGQFPDIVLGGGFRVESFDSPDNNLEAVFKYLVSP